MLDAEKATPREWSPEAPWERRMRPKTPKKRTPRQPSGPRQTPSEPRGIAEVRAWCETRFAELTGAQFSDFLRTGGPLLFGYDVHLSVFRGTSHGTEPADAKAALVGLRKAIKRARDATAPLAERRKVMLSERAKYPDGANLIGYSLPSEAAALLDWLVRLPPLPRVQDRRPKSLRAAIAFDMVLHGREPNLELAAVVSILCGSTPGNLKAPLSEMLRFEKARMRTALSKASAARRARTRED